MRLYGPDKGIYEKWQRNVLELFRQNFSFRREGYLLNDPEFMHDLLLIIEQKKMCRRPQDIRNSIAELRRIYRNQSDFHRTIRYVEGADYDKVDDEMPEHEVAELREGDDE